ncbi:MAG: dTMP kinase [Rectinema sp.]
MPANDSDIDLKNFIVFEGIDGSGTTTQLGRLTHALEATGIDHYATAEPTSRPEGALIRKILSGALDAAPGTVAHLFAADRHEHLYGAGGILAHLAAGRTVICDRYVLSSLAYQGTTCGPDLPRFLNSRFPAPGLTIYFAIDPEQSMARLGTRGTLEIYEKIHIQKSVCARYADAISEAREAGWNIIELDAAAPAHEVTEALFAAVGSHLGVRLAPA